MSQQSDAHDRARAIAEVEADDRPMPGQYL
jgi:hypothetical protein